MSWTHLGTQFCLTLAFGLLLGLSCIPKVPLGPFFFRMMGTTAMIPLAGAILGPPLVGDSSWSSPVVVASALAVLAFPVIQAPVKARTRALALYWSTICCGAAIVFAVQEAPLVAGPGAIALAALSTMATGGVAGGVGLAMVVGHWYLTVPQLPVSWLQRLNRYTIVAMLASLLFLGLSVWLHAPALEDSRTPLLGPYGLFYLGGRISVGMALPLLFAWMAAGSLRYQNTRSATGILYASTVVVLIGAAASLSLQDTYGVPL
ncbi:MAG: hypothetical protein ACI835_000993 [Planctomycetota bacterium]|jgi:hypothetical protein